MADETLDSLQIEITSSSDNAVNALNGLVSSLKKLDKIGKSSSLEAVKKQLQGIARIKFDNLSVQLAAVTAYIKALQKSGKKLSEIVFAPPAINTEPLSNQLGEMVDDVRRRSEEVRTVSEEFGGEAPLAEWVANTKKSCQETLDSFDKLSSDVQAKSEKLRKLLESKKDEFGETPQFSSASSFEMGVGDSLQKISLQVELLQEKFNKLNNQSGTPDKNEWYKLEQAIIAVKQRYQDLLRQTDRNAISIDMLGKKAVKSTSKMKKLFDRIKNIAMYRIVRFIFSKIAQAATEGIKNIAKFSESANQVMSAYKSEFGYINNSLGSALIPMLQAMLPTVIRIGDALADIFNSLGMIGAWINGSKTFVKAKKYTDDYTKSLENAKRSLTGFDELNILGKQEESSNVADMFEEVEIGGTDVAASFGKIAAAIAGITAFLLLIKGAKVKAFFVDMGKGIATAWKYLKNVSGWKKAGIAIAALAVEAVAVFNGFYDARKGTKSWGQTLLELVPICAVVGAAMYAMLGPVGIVIAAVVALVSAIAGVVKAKEELKYKTNMEKFFAAEGVAIDEVTQKLNLYFQSLGIDKQEEWNKKLEETIIDLNDARLKYDTLWASITNKELSTKQIDGLRDAFNELADAANAVNEAAIGSLMASIATGIQMNITPELTARLGELVNSLEVASDLLNVQIKGISAEYNKLLNDIAANGGKYTPEQYEQLKTLRGELDKYTLKDTSASVRWDMDLASLQKKGVNAGFNQDEVKSALSELAGKRDSYLETMAQSYAEGKSTLLQLINLYPDLFTQSDLDALTESYNAQVAEVVSQYNNVVQAIYNSLSQNAIKLEDVAGYKDESGKDGFKNFWSNFGYGFLKGITFGIYESGDKKAYDKQQKFLKELLEYTEEAGDYQIPAHANGGVVEDGLFMANHSEIVGQFSNGKTVAANNMQIIEGIKQGVIEAMQESGGQGGGDWIIQIVDEDGGIKGEKIISAAERKNRRDGRTVISVGV